jgi:hypothetical protein
LGDQDFKERVAEGSGAARDHDAAGRRHALDWSVS